VPDSLPLPAQLSAAFVAFTIEADNAAEQRLSHTTTAFGSSGERGAVWLASLAMWFNCVGPLTDAGGELTAAALQARARMTTNLDGMRRWGYITIDGTGRVPRLPGGAGRPHAKAGSVLALTERGAAVDALWRPLPGVIEQRWHDRFGAAAIDRLRAALLAVATADAAGWPDFMPILHVHDVGIAEPEARDPASRAEDARLSLVSLVARVVLRYTLDYDRGAGLGLALWSDLVRVLDADRAVAVRALPAETGVSKEALAMMTGMLERTTVVLVEPVGGSGRGKQLRLSSARGVRARAAGARRIAATVTGWERQFGADVVTELRDALGPVVGDGTRDGSPLFAGLDPAPDTWRAHVVSPRLLPWYPLVLHRGGYPDGS
jgi:hypothetical protein